MVNRRGKRSKNGQINEKTVAFGGIYSTFTSDNIMDAAFSDCEKDRNEEANDDD